MLMNVMLSPFLPVTMMCKMPRTATREKKKNYSIHIYLVKKRNIGKRKRDEAKTSFFKR
jgi:hypothetical protein